MLEDPEDVCRGGIKACTRGNALMDRQLLKAATRGSFEESDSTLKETVSRNRSMVLARTAEGNTCLHISSMHGHGGFCDAVLELDESLLSLVNSDGETPLLTAITSGHASLAFSLLRRCNKPGLSDSILRHDNNECNALHHAIRGGHKALALELIRTQPALSQGVNKFNESPMYLALTRDYRDVFEELFAIPGSAHSGSYSYNVLHAAVKHGNIGENYITVIQFVIQKKQITWLSRIVNFLLICFQILLRKLWSLVHGWPEKKTTLGTLQCRWLYVGTRLKCYKYCWNMIGL